MDNPMFNALWAMIGQQFAKLPPAAQVALAQTEVRITRKEGTVIIEPVPQVDNDDTRKVRDLLVDGFIQQFPTMISKSFRVNVKVYG